MIDFPREDVVVVSVGAAVVAAPDREMMQIVSNSTLLLIHLLLPLLLH